MKPQTAIRSHLAVWVFLLTCWLVLKVPSGLLFWVAFALFETTVLIYRRRRDALLANDAWRGNENTGFKVAAIAEIAAQSRLDCMRPQVCFACCLGIFLGIASWVDEYGQCFWNWECVTDLDCNLRILTPAVLQVHKRLSISSPSLSPLSSSVLFYRPRVCLRVCVCVRARACMRACVRACV